MPRKQEDQPELAAAIRWCREGQNLTQGDLGERIGMHTSGVSHIESGRINIGWGTARRIAAGLNITLPYLVHLAEQFEPEVRKDRPRIGRSKRFLGGGRGGRQGRGRRARRRRGRPARYVSRPPRRRGIPILTISAGWLEAQSNIADGPSEAE